jgi:hypothetical protein
MGRCSDGEVCRQQFRDPGDFRSQLFQRAVEAGQRSRPKLGTGEGDADKGRRKLTLPPPGFGTDTSNGCSFLFVQSSPSLPSWLP